MIDREKDWNEILSNPNHDHCDSYVYQLAMQFGNEGQANIAWLNFIEKKRSREEYCRIIVHGSPAYRQKAWDMLSKLGVKTINLRYLVRRAPMPWAEMAFEHLLENFRDEDMRLLILADFFNEYGALFETRAINLILEHSTRPACLRVVMKTSNENAKKAWCKLKEGKIPGPELCKLCHITRKVPELSDIRVEIEERISKTTWADYIKGEWK